MCGKAFELRAEHRHLYVQICDVVEHAIRVRESQTDQTRVEQLASEFRSFDERLRAHESAENELIFSEYDDDLGGGD